MSSSSTAEPIPAAHAGRDVLTLLPRGQALCRPPLDDLAARLAGCGTKALLIRCGGRVVFEWYAHDHGPDRKHYIASTSKTVVGGLSLALLMGEGLIVPDARAADFIPAWRDDRRKSRITVRHLATHSCGLQDAHADGVDHADLPGWMGAFWRREPDPFTLSRDAAPVLFEPGERHHYSNTGMAMLGWVLTEALRRAGSPHRDLRTLLAERVFQPIGLKDSEWEVGYGQTFAVDGLPLVATWGGGSFTARALGLIGQLLLQRGVWNGTQLIQADALDAALADSGAPHPDREVDPCALTPGLGFWTNRGRQAPIKSLPRGAFAGAGAGHQVLLIVPEWDMVVVRQGAGLGGNMRGFKEGRAMAFWEALDALLFKPLVAAIAPPIPPSPVIADIHWAPPDAIIRHGYHSDLWPMTWADDDWLYTVWGDGKGFEPFIETRCSMGLARVGGHPPDLTLENVRSKDAEDLGDGRRGRKANGLLMVEGVLYMLRRNADQDGHMTEIGWSDDHGVTWTFADWKFEALGAVTFLNFGRNYAGARDPYVYLYGHDRDTAYRAADRMILMRVPATKQRLMDRAAYAYFVGLDDSGRPSWTNDFARRGAVFTHPGRCRRSGISFNAPLRRYLWWHQDVREPEQDGEDTRFHSGLGVYDAPEPWGPWTCAYFRECWDVGPGESGCFPTKWISADGRHAHLVFSGNDYMSIRAAQFILR